MQKINIEICAFSIDAAKIAEKAGADRIELCSNPMEGGTTPHFGLIKAVCEKVKIPVYPIIRPRGGDFCYLDDELELIKNDILICKELGCKGIAIGILTKTNKVDLVRLKQIVELAHPMRVTFIRAFDVTPDPFEALEQIIEAGCERILTSGQAPYAADATTLIKKLVEQAGDRISIMPGSGVRAENLKQLIKATGAWEFHSSARIFIPNQNSAVDNLGFGQPVSCKPQQIRKMREIADIESNHRISSY